MPDPKFFKPWHGVPRESIDWRPTVNKEACIGCGTCVTGCKRQVYRFDYDRKKPVVADPLNCMVGCTTCANSCPTHVISFPPLSMVMDMAKQPTVRHAIEDDLIARREQLAWEDRIPHPDRLVQLVVDKMTRAGENNVVVILRPPSEADCLCSSCLASIWSCGCRRVHGCRVPIPSATRFTRVAPSNRSFAEWREDALIPARLKMKLGDVGTARGPLGTFRIRSPLSTPLLFVARGTGFAPIKAMIEQQLTLAPDREMLLYWGVTDTGDFYDLEELTVWAASDPHFRATLTARHDSLGFRAPVGVRFFTWVRCTRRSRRANWISGHGMPCGKTV